MRRLSLLALLATLVIVGIADAQTPKRGGILNSMVTEDPPGFSIHESATVSTVWPLSPCYNNLVYFDAAKSQETVDTIVGELAEKWSWQDNHRNLVFFLGKNVEWRDGLVKLKWYLAGLQGLEGPPPAVNNLGAYYPPGTW